MSKLNALVKVAISFGDTRRMLLRVGNLGVKVERNLPNYVKKNTPTSAFSPFTKKIYIPRKKDIDPNILKKIYKNNFEPRKDLMHESGHVIALRKYLTRDNKKYYAKILSKSKNPLKILKDERMANRTALQNISNKIDRDKFIKDTKTPYQSYKNFVMQNKGFKTSVEINKIPEGKKLVQKLWKTEDPNEIKKTTKELTNIAKQLIKKDPETRSSIAPSFKKKNYIV